MWFVLFGMLMATSGANETTPPLKKNTPLITENQCQKNLTKEEFAEAINCFQRLSNYFYEAGNDQESLKYDEIILSIQETFLEENHPDIATTLNNMGLTYFHLGQYGKAIQHFQKAVDINKQHFGEKHPSVATNLNNMGTTYSDLGEYEKAIQHFQKAFDIEKQHFDKKHPSVAITLNNMGRTYFHLGQYEKALQYLQKSIDINKQHFGEKHPSVATILTNLGLTHHFLGQYEKALKYYQKAIDISKHHLGDNHPNVATILANLGMTYHSLGQYGKAIQHFQKAVDIYEHHLGENHPSVAITLNNMGLTYSHLGQYGKAIQHFQKAVDINKQHFGEKHPSVAATLNNIGLTYSHLGQYGKAIQHFQKALDINKQHFGEKHPSVAMNLNNMGRTYFLLGQYEKALQYLQKAIDINKQHFGENHPSVATTLTNLGLTYHSLGQYKKALQHFQKAFDINKQHFGEKHPDIAMNLNNLGGTYHSLGQYGKTIEHYQNAINIYEHHLGENHPSVTTILTNLGDTYYRLGHYGEALNSFMRSERIEEHNLEGHLGIGSLSEKRQYMDTLWTSTSIYLSTTTQLPSDPDSLALGARTVLRRKTRSLAEEQAKNAALHQNISPELQTLFDSLQEDKRWYASLSLKPPQALSKEERQQQMEQLSQQIRQKEKQLRQQSQLYAQQSKEITVPTVAKELNDNELLMEWMVFEYFPVDDTPSELRLVLMTLDHTENVGWYDLGLWDAIEPSVTAFRKSIINKSSDVQQKGHELWTLLMSPAEQEISSHSSLILSPDSTLHLIPFSALTTDNDQWLIETHSVRYVSSGRDLLYDLPIKAKSPPLIIANPNFNYNEEDPQSSEDPTFSLLDNNRSSRELTNLSFSHLPGTKREADKIQQLLNLSDEQVWTENDASEKEFRSIQSPYILHIATHGFFLPDQQRTASSRLAMMTETPIGPVSEDPMLRSGLAFRGANHVTGSGEDGLLTAFEIANMDLYGTELVVLSACETGVGETTIGEGVAGLKQALVLAGSRTQVLSLWKVDDDATQMMMSTWYQNLLDGEEKVRSFQDIQLDMAQGNITKETYSADNTGRALAFSRPDDSKQQVQQNDDWSHPYYWSGFTISGQTGSLDWK